jgi:chorismate mutase
MSSAAPWSEQADKLSLSSIREMLIRQEDTIIFALLERAQYAQNLACYSASDQKYSSLTGGGASLLDYMLLETERLHARVRRYTSPDEHAFFPHRLPAPALPLIEFPQVLHPNMVNLNGAIMDMYLTKVLPDLCAASDDGHHGSSVTADIAVLQAISRRVHYGFFVAESKFRAQPEEYTRLIEARDEDGIMALLTNSAVEAHILRRVATKAATFGQEIEPPPNEGGAAVPAKRQKSDDGKSSRVDPELLVRMYRDHVIPLTKVAEVQYLLQRLTPSSIAHDSARDSICARVARQYANRVGPPGKQGPQLLRLPNAEGVFEAVMSSKAFLGVCLLERGDSGILSDVRSLLIENPLRIVGELVHHSRFRLVSRCTDVQDVRKIVGRADVLRRCQSWLRQMLVQSVELEGADYSALTAAAIEEATAGREVAYLVETHTMIDERKLNVLVHAPTDIVETATCVLISQASKNISSPSGHDKTIIYLSLLNNSVGTLADALAVLTRHGVNLLSIRSYTEDAHDPRRVDFIATAEGHEEDSHLSASIAELRAKNAVVRILGSFAVPQGPAALVLSSDDKVEAA